MSEKVQYFIYDSDGCEYRAKIKDVKKLIVVAYNYCGSLCKYSSEDDKWSYIYDSHNDIENNIDSVKEYGIELKDGYIGSSECIGIPFYKGKNLFEEYKNVKIEEIGKETKAYILL